MSNITKHLQWEIENMVDSIVDLYDLTEPEASSLLLTALNNQVVWEIICEHIEQDLEEKNDKS